MKICFVHESFLWSRNLDWLYSTAAGRQQIISSAKFTTIAFIYLQSDQDYRDLEQVQSEMTEAVLDFKPANLPDNIQIPFLSSSEGIGQVNIREKTSSFIIEDCLYGNENQWKRRLRFEASPNLIQSEIDLTPNDRELNLTEKKKIRTIVVCLVKPNYSLLENDYHGVIVTCLKSYFNSNSKRYFSR